MAPLCSISGSTPSIAPGWTRCWSTSIICPTSCREHLQARSGPPVVRTAFEPELLGSAGTLRHHRAWVQDEEFFLALNADNLTDFDLRHLIDFHRSGSARQP